MFLLIFSFFKCEYYLMGTGLAVATNLDRSFVEFSKANSIAGFLMDSVPRYNCESLGGGNSNIFYLSICLGK